ncbi:hypothetical protein LUZ60_001047 [Juncus effusus]|nr:hypothetical protein LUZ60_001047 [Juncus effusus]
MDFELRAARQKLEREQKERKERAKAKAERERRAKAEAARQRDALEAAQRVRRLDAARAQLEAERQMEENLILGSGINFTAILEAFPYNGQGDKIKLPSSCFKELSDQGALDKGPMFFRLTKVNQETLTEKSFTHCGVLEFTATEGTVQIPTHIWNNLFPEKSGTETGTGTEIPLIELKYVNLPKGTYAKLKPNGTSFYDLPNHKALLETSLRNHSTLSQGDKIRVLYGQNRYELEVLELKPSTAVSVLETDLDVDIEGLGFEEKEKEMEKEQNVLVPIEFGTSQNGVVKEGNFDYYKFSVDDTIGEIIQSGLSLVEITLETENNNNNENDTDIYVSKHPLIFPTQHRHEWSCYGTGTKNLVLRPNVGTYTIGIYGFKGESKYQILVRVKNIEANGQKLGQNETVPNSEDLVECKNCKKYVSSRTLFVHEAYCFRHNVLCQFKGCNVVVRKEERENHVHCEKCGLGFQRGELEKHLKVFHVPIECPCGVILEKEQMVHHQATTCPVRLIVCRFCGDMVQAGADPSDPRDRLRGLTQHESLCGSRTAPCDSCGRSVMLKDMDLHNVAVHQKS